MTDQKALGGIVNMGLTCYANVILQAFRHCEKIPWIFAEGRYSTLFEKEPSKKRGEQQDICKSFANVVQLLETCKRGEIVRPADFWSKFRRYIKDTAYEDLLQKRSHDSNEFYVVLLDILHEAISQKVEMQVTRPEPVTEADKHCIQALEVWRAQFHNTYSPLIDLLNGLMHKTTQCTKCLNKSHRWETFTDLKAVVPTSAEKPPTLLEMIEKNLEEEIIEDYDCEHCRPHKQRATSRSRIWRLPLYLIVNLKRFGNDGRRIDTPIASLPNDGAEPISFQHLFSQESPEQPKDMSYKLHSTIDHHGSSTGGHYTAQCSKGDGSWHVYDDEGVISIPKLQFGPSTYMVWLSRV